MKGIVLALMTLSYSGPRLPLIDTIDKYKSQIELLDENDDCTVRTIAEAFDLRYRTAHSIVKRWGRETGFGMRLTQFLFGLKGDFGTSIVGQDQLEQQISPNQFVKQIAEDGYSYIVIGQAHVFVIEQMGTKNRWFIKGNYNDRQQKIIAYLKIKN